MTKQDSLDLVALHLGRRNAKRARGHLVRALNHIERAGQALAPIIGLADVIREAPIVTAAVAEYLTRVDSRLDELDRRRVGPKVTDLAVAEEAVRRPAIRAVRPRRRPVETIRLPE